MLKTRKFILAFAALAAFGVVTMAPAQHAVAQTLEQAQGVNEWATRFQRIVTAFVTPLQQLPQPPAPDMNRTERRAWAANARQWATNAQASFATARSQLDALPPSPPTHDAMSDRLRTAIESALPRLRESLDAGDRISAAYLELADAVERNQMGRVDAIRVTAIEAALVSTRLFQDTNAAQAAASMDGNPQGPLAGAYAQSYAALYAILNYRLQIMRGEEGDRATAANAIASAAAQMRASIAEGRADVALVSQQLRDPAVVASIDSALVPRLRAVASTFPTSFNREEEIAHDFESIAALLRGGGGDQMEAQIDVHLTAFSERDARRMDDIAQRNRIMTAP